MQKKLFSYSALLVKLLLCLLSVSLFIPEAKSYVQIDITRGSATKIPVIFYNCNNTEGSKEIFNIIRNDLHSSAIFEVKELRNSNDLVCNDDASFNYSNIILNNINNSNNSNDRGANALNTKPSVSNNVNKQSKLNNNPAKAIWSPGEIILTLKVTSTRKGLEAKMRLIDPAMKQQLLGKGFTGDLSNYRSLAHTIADSIYSRITGEKGYFNTKIAYISEHNNAKRLAMVDQDGANNIFLTDGKVLVLTPRFSPDNQSIIYMSYLDRMGKVYLKSLASGDSGKDKLIGDFTGTVSAPRFSPSGKQIIMARASEDVTDIYTIELKNRHKKKLTVHSAINTSPSYSPDGKKIVFNSDRGGSPQLYVMNIDGSGQHRISFGPGIYMNPVWSPRGDFIAFTKAYRKTFYIGVMKPDGSGERIIATGYLVEGPSWSPSGRLLLFTREERLGVSHSHKPITSKIYSIDVTGRNERLIKTPFNASDPSWSDLL